MFQANWNHHLTVRVPDGGLTSEYGDKDILTFVGAERTMSRTPEVLGLHVSAVRISSCPCAYWSDLSRPGRTANELDLRWPGDATAIINSRACVPVEAMCDKNVRRCGGSSELHSSPLDSGIPKDSHGVASKKQRGNPLNSQSYVVGSISILLER